MIGALGVAIGVLCRGFRGVSDTTRVRIKVLGGDEPAPKGAETARDDGLSRNRFCCSFQAVILRNSVSKDRQLADSFANVFRVRNWAASFS